MPKNFNRVRPEKNVNGFASIQFVILMGFTILLLTGFFNILFIEYQRSSILTSLHDAARAGTRVVNLKSTDPADAPFIDQAKTDCKNNGESAMKDLFNAPNLKVQCDITVNASGLAVMNATLVGKPDAVIVPWAIPYENFRLVNLKESYTQRENANG